MRTGISALVLLAVGAACGGANGTRPRDMSAATHETSAAMEERVAAEHEICAKRRGVETGPCWSGYRNPTPYHLEEAKEARNRAAAHRAASQALRDAEARACAGIDPEDRDQSPFAHREDIAWVESVDRHNATMQGPARLHSVDQLVGAKITFRAVRGLTAEWLQRVVDCHIARNAALGHDVPEMAYCPLVPKGVKANVTSVAGGFAVEIVADDLEGAREVLRRARMLSTTRESTERR